MSVLLRSFRRLSILSLCLNPCYESGSSVPFARMPDVGRLPTASIPVVAGSNPTVFRRSRNVGARCHPSRLPGPTLARIAVFLNHDSGRVKEPFISAYGNTSRAHENLRFLSRNLKRVNVMTTSIHTAKSPTDTLIGQPFLKIVNKMVSLCSISEEAEGVAVFPDSSSLQDVGVRNQMTLQVVDTAHKAKELLLPAMGAFSNERQSKIQWLNEESYDKRPDTMRQFLRKLKSQKQATATPESASGAEPNVCTLRGPSEIQTAAAPQTLSVGQRCEVLALGGVRGEIVFIGKRQQKDGQWVGILLDEPLGVDGVPHCPSRYGYFVKYKDFASKVLIGDYPPVDLTELVAS